MVDTVSIGKGHPITLGVPHQLKDFPFTADPQFVRNGEDTTMQRSLDRDTLVRLRDNTGFYHEAGK